MELSIRGPARERLTAREQIDRAELAQLQASGALVIDDRRRRPLYFDGRFLAARDLTREQNYFLTRQADLGRAGGAGVVQGLLVGRGPTATTITLDAGHGVTASGELVMLPAPLTVPLADIAEAQRLNAAFGLLHAPHEPQRNRTGLFVVALRAVEFTANPIASYPTTVSGPRTVQDGDIVEATAVTLIPYPDQGARTEWGLRRARAARDIFLAGGAAGMPDGALPVAMIAVDRGVVQWVDPFLVRREVGAEHGDILGLGLAPRALREAGLLQYDQHLADLLEERRHGNRGERFAASEVFLALPPAGRLPAAAVDGADFTQSFFPAEMTVELSILPEDEVPALLEDSLRLPPIDLTLSGDDLASTAVLVLIPVPRARLRPLLGTLAGMGRALPPVASGLLARRAPLDRMQGLRLPHPSGIVRAPDSAVDAAWAAELKRVAAEAGGLLWYVRQRNLSYRGGLTGVAIAGHGDEVAGEQALTKQLTDGGLADRFTQLKARTSAAATASIVALLASPKFAQSPVLLEAGLHELEAAKPAQGETLDRVAVETVAARFADPHLGEGLARLVGANADLEKDKATATALAASGALPELDLLGRHLADANLAAFAAELGTTAKAGDPAAVAKLIMSRLEGTHG